MTRPVAIVLVAAALAACHAAAPPVARDGSAALPSDFGIGVGNGGDLGFIVNGGDAGAVNAAACAQRFDVGATSHWVAYDANGRLRYTPFDAQGDRIADFSYAGYHNGGVALPVVPVAMTVMPSGGDDTAAIQAALDSVGKLPLAGGVRGAVLLAPGNFTVAGTLAITTSGVVLRGSGSGAGGTRVSVPGNGQRVVTMSGSGTRTILPAPKTTLTDAYVPSGASRFTVASAAGFAVGDAVLVERPVTMPWVHFMGMDTLVRADMQQTWLAVGSTKHWERTITAVDGDTITIDIPLTDSFDARYVTPPGGSLQKYSFAGRISEVGLEHVAFVAPPRSATSNVDLVYVDSVADGWVRDVSGVNFTNGVTLDANAKRITVSDCAMRHDAGTYFTAAAPFDYQTNGEETLVMRSSSMGGLKIWYYATHDGQGPNVVLDFTASGTNSHLAPHERWTTGFLVDGAHVAGGIELYNQGTTGTGHGWAVGWGVAWNCTADTTLESPPGSTNWGIGCSGVATSEMLQGTYDSPGVAVAPSSLYLAQLCERLGPDAVAAIGY